MNDETDPVFTHPEDYGIENIEEPGEPDRSKLDDVSPVPGTKKMTRGEHEGTRGGQHHVTEGSGHSSSRGGRGGHGGHH